GDVLAGLLVAQVPLGPADAPAIVVDARAWRLLRAGKQALQPGTAGLGHVRLGHAPAPGPRSLVGLRMVGWPSSPAAQASASSAVASKSPSMTRWRSATSARSDWPALRAALMRSASASARSEIGDQLSDMKSCQRPALASSTMSCRPALA